MNRPNAKPRYPGVSDAGRGSTDRSHFCLMFLCGEAHRQHQASEEWGVRGSCRWKVATWTWRMKGCARLQRMNNQKVPSWVFQHLGKKIHRSRKSQRENASCSCEMSWTFIWVTYHDLTVLPNPNTSWFISGNSSPKWPQDYLDSG